MALGILGLMTVGATAISGVGIGALFLAKEHRKKVLCSLTVWGVILAVLQARSLPTNFVFSQVVAWGFGALSIIGILLYLNAKSEKQLNISYGLVVVSIVANLLSLFYI